MNPVSTGNCPLCKSNIPQPLDPEGLCHYHSRHASGRQKGILRHIGISRNVPEPREDINLIKFYIRRIPLMTGRCWECDAIIATWNAKYAKAAIAHILPKRDFFSVRANDYNFLELGADCGCHDVWDKDWESAVSMKVFRRAAERFLLFYPAIAAVERSMIPECFTKLIV